MKNMLIYLKKTVQQLQILPKLLRLDLLQQHTFLQVRISAVLYSQEQSQRISIGWGAHRCAHTHQTLTGVVIQGLCGSVFSDKESVFEFGICVGFGV